MNENEAKATEEKSINQKCWLVKGLEDSKEIQISYRFTEFEAMLMADAILNSGRWSQAYYLTIPPKRRLKPNSKQFFFDILSLHYKAELVE